MRKDRALAAAFVLLLATAPGTAADEWPDWVERWLFNGEERTARALQVDSAEKAVAPLETALRLAESDPVAMYNAGTGRLAAGRGEPAALLAAAAASGRRDLAPNAHYNLGNFLLAQDQYSAAVEAYKNALRANPDFADAKFNLELAQRLLAEEQQEQEQDPQEQQQEEQDQENQQEEEQQQQEQQQEQQQQEQEQQEEGEQEQQEQQQEQDQGPLPEFRDLPDMTAEEAAAILEAVENMERERRRKEAQEAARKTGKGKKDW